MSFRAWRRRLRLFKAIELLGGGLGVTQAAMELGYGSTSAFVYAFRTEIGASPQAYMRGRAADRAVPAGPTASVVAAGATASRTVFRPGSPPSAGRSRRC